MILVFGKNGQVAKELDLHANIITLDRYQADLLDADSCAKAIEKYKPNAVINAAAYTAVDKAQECESDAYQINAIAPGIMAEACAKLNIPLVHISTDYVFEGTGDVAWKPSDNTSPQNVYGASKRQGETSVIQSGATYGIIRTSWVVSAHGKNFVKTMIKLSKSHDIVKVVGDQIGGPTAAKDIANTCINIANQLIENPHKSGVYHYSGAPDVSWCEFANAIFKIINSDTIATSIPTSEYPTPAKRPLNSRLDCQLTSDVFHIDRPSWRESLINIIDTLGDSS